MPTAEINDFLGGSLVTWFVSCLDDSDALCTYDDLVDGVLLHQVFLDIDCECLRESVVPSRSDIPTRTRNLQMLIGKIWKFYENELGQVIIKLPNAWDLGKEPELHIEDMKLLLQLLLGCAVQCHNKKAFIDKMQTLPPLTQEEIMKHITQVTESHNIVIPLDSMDSPALFTMMKNFMDERDFYCEKWWLAETRPCPGDSSAIDLDDIPNIHEMSIGTYGTVTLSADWKTKIREQRQELEEKTEALLECKEELELANKSLSKLEQNNQELIQEVRNAKCLRDELDAVLEKAERADTLETQVARLHEKLTDIEFYKTRIDQLQVDNGVLMENSKVLEGQLTLSRRRADKILELESQIVDHKKIIDDMAEERVRDSEKFQKLIDENNMLQKLKKAADDEAARLETMKKLEEPTPDKKLSEQLSQNAQTRALKLELENRRLMALVDSLEESALQELSMREHFSELENEKEQMANQVESLTEEIERLRGQNERLSIECENLLRGRQTLEANFVEAKNQLRTLKESYDELEDKNKQIIMDQGAFDCNSNQLNNLREEHQHLQDDFKTVFAVAEKLNVKYNALQEEYSNNIVETKLLKKRQQELREELSEREESYSNLVSHTSQLNQRYDILLSMHSGLDNHRRSLMDHVTVLVNQYHDLLNHSFEDKEHYHMEEKLYRDQVNHLSRQKEKLEEKIMDYYRTKQSCSTKKKRFGANLVQRVRKVGSDLINKNRDETKHFDGKMDESESGGNDSDLSEEDRRAGNSLLHNGSYSLELSGLNRSFNFMDHRATAAVPSTKPQKLPQSLIDDDRSNRPVHNKMCAELNESRASTLVEEECLDEGITGSSTINAPKSENSIWQECGCA